MVFFKKNLQIILLCAILAIGVIVRLQNFYLPPIDAHPMRQTDTECIAYNFANTNSNILHPKACLIRPQINKEGFFFLEFPLYQYGLGMLYKLLGPEIAVARIYNLLLYLIAAVSLFYFIRRFIGSRFGLISTFLYSFAPGSIFFIGHAIHPDVFATTTVMTSLAIYIYSTTNKKLTNWFVISVLLFSISIATRPFMLLALPSFVYLLYLHKALRWQYLILIFGSVFIYALWRIYLLQYPKTYHEWEYWVLQGREQLKSFDILVKGLIYKNVIGEILGKFNFLLASLGLLTSIKKGNKLIIFALLWLAGVPLYWFIVPNGNIIHQYYANVYLIPFILLATIGLSFVIDLFNNNHIKATILSVAMLLVVYNGYRTSKYYFNDLESSNYIQIAKQIQRYVPEDKKLVYLATLNSIPFSLAHRQGWVLGAPPVDVEHTTDAILNMRQYGAEYVVAGYNNVDLNKLELKVLEQNSKIIAKNKWVIIYKLK